jgi:hypothetical protein
MLSYNDNFVMNVTIVNSTGDAAVNVYDGSNNTFRNCTIVGNNSAEYAILLQGTSTNNKFYYNNISGDFSIDYAGAQSSGNHFNTTVGGVAQGNYWEGVGLLKIYDTNNDDFGDAGLAYPYNSANGGNVNVNVTDFGPMTTRTDYLIQAPIPSQPGDDSLVTDSRNPLYGWTDPEHTLSDTVTYHIQVDDNNDFGSPVISKQGIVETPISTYYWNETSLSFFTTYYWRVRAYDTFNWSDWSVVWAFSILPTTSCVQPSDEVDFGSMCINANQTICDQRGWGSHINDTLDNYPPPYTAMNDGNLKSKGKVYSTNLWESTSITPMPNKYYAYMIGVNEPGAYDWALDSAWYNMTNSSSSALEAYYGAKWENVSDLFNAHIRLESPTDEPPGIKYSTTYVTCEQNETYY